MTIHNISVLMPAYNAEKYISEAIESILNQTYKEFEFIIIDDCSTDNTWNIIQNYTKKDARISAFRNENNLGISASRNKLISLSQGAYIVWQDSDDISFPYRIQHQYEFMEAHPEVGICGGYLQFFNESGNTSVRKYASDDKSLRKTIFRYSPVAQPAAIIRKECFQKIGLFPLDSPVAADLALSFQIGTKYYFANIEELLIRYREHTTNVTHKKLRVMELYTIFLRYKYANETNYHMSLFDNIYNSLHTISIFIIPSKLKILIFNLIRNS